MAQLKKSDLKKHLRGSVQIFKKELNYRAYLYLILTMFFFYNTGAPLTTLTVAAHHTATTQLSAKPTVVTPRIAFQRRRRDLQHELIDGFSLIETYVPRLKGVLLPAVSEVSISDATLSAFRDHLDQLQDSTTVFSSAKNFEQAFEYWVSELAKMTVKRGVSFYTQPALVNMLVELLKPTEDMLIYDPTAGTGGMLVGCARYIQQQGGNMNAARFYGREQELDIWAICNLNMAAHDIENVTIEQGDTLQSPRNLLGSFDLVIQNLPLPLNPDNYGQTRQRNAAFLQHAIHALAPNGRGAVLAPASILQQEHQDIWRFLINRDWLEAVITLPPTLLQGTSAAACVLLLNKNKVPDRQARVLFARVAPDLVPRSRYNELQDSDVRRVVQAFEHWENTPDFTRIVSTNRIEELNYSFNMDRYAEWEEAPQSFEINGALQRYRSAVQKRQHTVEQLMKNLDEFYNSTQPLDGGKSPE